MPMVRELTRLFDALTLQPRPLQPLQADRVPR